MNYVRSFYSLTYLYGSELTLSSSSLNKKVKAVISSNAEHCEEVQCGTNNLLIKFKQEPMILHVACKDLDSAKEIMKVAQNSGFKKVGIISLGKNIVVEINGTEKMEFPILNGKNILVDEAFLKLIVKESNSRMKRNWLKIKKFEESFR